MDSKSAGWLRVQADRALAYLHATGEVRVAVVDDAVMTAAHARHMNDPTTTDVLTFDLRDAADIQANAPLDVDVMVCVDIAEREASARGFGVERELLLYVVHAALHCLGHDDVTDEQALAMHACEDEVMSALGVGATFNVAGHAGNREAR